MPAEQLTTPNGSGGPASAVLTADEVEILLNAAVHAPSQHNTQPWRFEVHGPVVDVLIDEERVLPVEDPAGRAARIGIGAAAFNIRVAAAMLGHESRIALNPDPARSEVAARIFLAARSTPVPELGSLYGVLRRRHTYRGPLLSHPIAHKLLHRLDDAAEAEGAQLHWLDPAAAARLHRLLDSINAEELRDEDRIDERRQWIGSDRSDDGVQEGALGAMPDLPAFVRDLSAGFGDKRDHVQYETFPMIAVLSTPEEDGVAWIRAGLALERVLLVATSYDLATSFLNQVLEHVATRYEVRGLIGGQAWPQMIIRIGYPADTTPRTPRRDWHASFDHWF
ncbi:Acg family FMN-binding oxidoreductase [Kribbella speibonae]|uniref:Nitroreductase n=1 Tax=Kribbella speibonae TaxID=1572660 RepID=A0A4V2M353_9ACTN|nr:nitroreductase family protein [Kribbella speibonae]TCC30732.1 hypothetical protein E0H92_37045 [Kribbella speibonae]